MSGLDIKGMWETHCQSWTVKECGRPRVGPGNGRVKVTHSEGDDVPPPSNNQGHRQRQHDEVETQRQSWAVKECGRPSVTPGQ